MEKIDYCEKINAYITNYIKFADVKAGSILAFTSAVGGGLLSQADKFYGKTLTISSCMSHLFLIFFVLSLFFCLMVIWHCLVSLSPRAIVAKSLNSFPDISKYTVDEYVKKIELEITPKSMVTEYTRHNWTLAQITSRKFLAINTSIQYLKAFLVAIGALIVLAILTGVIGA